MNGDDEDDDEINDDDYLIKLQLVSNLCVIICSGSRALGMSECCC